MVSSNSYRMQGMLGEFGVPSGGTTTLSSQHYQMQPGFLAASLGPTGPSRIYLPVVYGPVPPTPTPTPTPLCNGRFTAGPDGLACWTPEGSLLFSSGQPAVQVTTDPRYLGQGTTALLGNPDYFCTGGVPDGDAYVAQTVIVPNSPNPTLTFWYDIVTQNVEFTSNNLVIDSFDVWINQPNLTDPSVGGTLIYRDGYQELPGSGGSGCSNAPNWVQKSGTVDLAAYRGQTITLYFANDHRGITSDNTYTYLTNVAVGSQ